jgi:hypothetical protein
VIFFSPLVHFSTSLKLYLSITVCKAYKITVKNQKGNYRNHLYIQQHYSALGCFGAVPVYPN